jgi:outer membrane protein OmpA-like peptidoglycan-associated protein
MRILLILFICLFFSSTVKAQIKRKFNFGFEQKDSDKDGISDKKDKCPETPPNTQVDAFGCSAIKSNFPILDTDLDGIPDLLDSCLKIAGVGSLNGCPDTDGDGIADHLDNCPKQSGPIELKGCPDRDNDGIQDDLDECPDAFGLAHLNGCMDLDGDNIVDQLDNCPTHPGSIANKGCPEIDIQLQKVLNEAREGIKFKKGSAEILSNSHPFLMKLIQAMQINQEMKFEIYCYTEEYKDKNSNEQLAVSRAVTIEAYLISKGIYSKRLAYKSFSKTDKTLPQRAGINNQTLILAIYINP